MPKFRYSLDSGTSWVVVDSTLPYNIPGSDDLVVLVEPIGNTVTLANLPASPSVTLTAGDGQVSIAWTDGSNGGAAITAHRIYVDGTGMSPITSASPYVLTGLANDVAVSIEVTAINSAGESARSAAQSVTPVAGGGASGFTLSANPKIIDAGDSLRAAGRDGSAALTYADTTNLGALEMMRAMYPYFQYDIYPANTSGFETGYGATEYTWGANVGYAGAPIDYVQSILSKIIAMSPNAIYWGPTINSVADAGILAKIDTLIDAILAAGIKLFLRTLPPVVQGSTFDNASYPTAYPAINAKVRARAAADPANIRLIDLDPAMCIGSTPYRRAGQTWDGTHNNEAGAIAEISVAGPVFAAAMPSTNQIESSWLAGPRFFPNAEMGGYGGSRSGVTAYGGPGFSVPSGYTISNVGSPTSTVVATVESNTARGGFTALGYITTTTLTVIETNGSIANGVRIGGPLVSTNTTINGAGAGGGVGTYPVSVSQNAGGVRTGSITSNVLTVPSGSSVIAVGQIVRPASGPDRTILSGSGTTWTVSAGADVASSSLTIMVPLNVGAQRLKLVVTPSGVQTEEAVQIIFNPQTFSSTAMQSKFVRGVALVELDSSPAWRMPYMLIVDRYNPGTETSADTAFAYKRDTNSDTFGGPGAGPKWLQTPSVECRADSTGMRMTLGLRWNRADAAGVFTAYVDLIDAVESEEDPATAYPLT
jgi:hypothetical protein